MTIYPSMPQLVVHGWVSSTARHPPGHQVGFHYHDVEEWLEVLKGDMTFVTLGGRPYKLSVGQVLRIPRGEAHRVDVGPNGVEYQMWVPVPAPGGTFANTLSPAEVNLISKNLDFPQREDNADVPFFDGILSDRLTFCGVDGVMLDGKKAFIGRGFVRRGRSSSGSVRILNRTPNSLLLSTVVTVTGPGGPPQSFTNLRLFVQEEGGLKCRLWVNYPEPG